MLGTAINVIEQSLITLAAIVVLSVLAANGQLPGLLSGLSQTGSIVNTFLNQTYSPLLISAATVSLSLVLAAAIIGGGFVYSAEYGLYLRAGVHGKATLAEIVPDGRRRWKSMAWTIFLANLITWGPIIFAYAIYFAFALSSPVTLARLVVLIASSYILNFALIASLILALFTVYSYPAVVVKQLSGLAAIKDSFRTAGQHLSVTFTYAVVRIIFQVLLTITVLSAAYVGLPLSSFSGAILSLLLTPILHSTKTMIYYHALPETPEMRFQLSNPIWRDLAKRFPRAAWMKVKTGLLEAGKYTVQPRNWPFHFLSALALIIGIVLGIYVSNNGFASFAISNGYQPGRINQSLIQCQPCQPIIGLNIFLNNWLVSIATGLAGIGFGFPSFATILFNGFILGLLVPLSPTLTMLYAAILPHGIIEIPSFILAGSVGMKLGYAAWRMLIGNSKGDEYLSKALRQTVYIVVGLAPVFLVAGLIEADVTPWIMRMFGWK